MLIKQNNLVMKNYLQLKGKNVTKTKGMEKIATGSRINRSSDDAAGLSISEKMRGQFRGLNRATQNVQEGFGLIQTAEGGLNGTAEVLQRMRELAVQAANPTDVVTERNSVQMEMDHLANEIDRVADSTEFNTRKLLNGDQVGFDLQIGANSGQTMLVDIGDMHADVLGVRNGAAAISLADPALASAAITVIDKAIEKVSTQRSHLGAFQNRLELTLKGLETSSYNLQTAESCIRDTDIAKEMMRYTGNSIKEQAAQSVSAQSNHLPERVLEILRDIS